MGSILSPDNVIRIPTNTASFFKWYLNFLEPFHHATPKEIEVAAAFIRKRFELSKGINDPILLDKYLMLEDTKREIREELNIKPPHFQVILGKLKKCKIILNDRINPKFIPSFKEKDFQLLILFPINDIKGNDSTSI